jgi:hypothetical protein
LIGKAQCLKRYFLIRPQISSKIIFQISDKYRSLGKHYEGGTSEKYRQRGNVVEKTERQRNKQRYSMTEEEMDKEMDL